MNKLKKAWLDTQKYAKGKKVEFRDEGAWRLSLEVNTSTLLRDYIGSIYQALREAEQRKYHLKSYPPQDIDSTLKV